MRVLLVTAVAALTAMLAAACSSGPATEAPPPVEPTPLRTPLPTATVDARRAERAEVLRELQAVPGVAEVIAAVEARDASTLVAQMFRHRGYCGWPTPAPGTVVPRERSHLAKSACFEGEVRFRGIRVEGVDVAGLWTPLAARAMLAQVFRPEHRWSFAGVHVEAYQRLSPTSTEGIEPRTRYVVRFESDHAAPLQLPLGDVEVRLLTLTIDLVAADLPQPDAIVELRLDEYSTDQRARVDIDSRTPAPVVDISPIVRSRVMAEPELAAVLPALSDLDALIEAMGPFEAHCIHPPLPGKETPEICELIGDPPERSYEAVWLDRITLFPIEIARLRRILTPMFATPPALLGAWHADDPTEASRERYYIALGGPLLEP